jgi:dienelactone hydrolase
MMQRGPMTLAFFVLLASTRCVSAAELDPVPEKMLQSHYRRLAHEALDRRLENYESLKTPEQFVAWQRDLRAKFIENIGARPAKTPLNARVIGRLDRGDHRIEKVIYESLPGFLVTANMYLPKGDGPFPGVLVPCGHSANGKAYANYQKVCILLARNGCAALIFDPPGQGERKQLLKAGSDGHDSHEGAFNATGEHMVTGVAPILLGENLATHMIRDGIRGIDYLCSRPDIDASKIGCTGNSGGGNQTSFLMAIDERIVAAAPGNFITTTRIKNERPGPGDAEQNIFGQTRDGLDHPDFVMLRAPKPTLILAATQDFVPIEGSWIAFRQAKRLYSRLGHPERVGLAETDDKHGYNSELRVAMVRFMRRWLLGIDDAITEPAEVEALPDRELLCTKHGQVLLESGSRSIFDLNRETAAKLAEKRASEWSALSDADQRSLVRRVAGIRKNHDRPQVTATVEPVEESSAKASVIRSQIRLSYDDLVLPGRVARRQDGKVNRCLLVLADSATPGGKDAITSAEQLAGEGAAVLSIDLAGLGSTTMKPWRYGSMSGVLGPNSAEWFVAYMLGESFVGLRANQILLASRWLQETTKRPAPVELLAIGEHCVPALHAAVVEPDLFGKVTLRQPLQSWQSVIDTPVTKRQLPNVIHGVLKQYDLPDLVKLVPAERLTIEQPLDAAGELITD